MPSLRPRPTSWSAIRSGADRTGDYVAALAHSKHSIWRHVPLPFSTVPTWCPENRKDDRLHISERLLNLDEVQPHYLPSLEERLGIHEAARANGVQLHTLKAATEGEIDTAFATLNELHAGALVVGSDPYFDGLKEHLVALAARHAVPAIYPWREA